MKTLKIGIDARMFSDSFTGIGRYNFELTKRLFEEESVKVGNEKHRIEWVIFMNEPEYSQFEFPPQVKKVCVNAPHYSFAEQWRFLRILQKEKCDLVHFTHFNLPLLYRKPFVVTVHDTTISFYPGKKMNAWWRKLAYQLVIRNAITASKKIITVSENTKTDVVRIFKTKAEKITPILIAPSAELGPSSVEQKQLVRKKFDLPDQFLLYTGNWREHKNLVGLVKSFDNLKDGFLNLGLVITGKEDPYYPEVKQTIAELKLEDRVRLLGLVDFTDLNTLLGTATVYVCPSFYEGFGLPPLEAMKCETAVVTSNTSSLPEVCGEAALYFDPNDVSDMTQKITKLLNDEKTRKELVKKGIKRVQAFSWDQCAESTFGSYVQALTC